MRFTPSSRAKGHADASHWMGVTHALDLATQVWGTLQEDPSSAVAPPAWNRLINSMLIVPAPQIAWPGGSCDHFPHSECPTASRNGDCGCIPPCTPVNRNTNYGSTAPLRKLREVANSQPPQRDSGLLRMSVPRACLARDDAPAQRANLPDPGTRAIADLADLRFRDGPFSLDRSRVKSALGAVSHQPTTGCS
jgi:hypothetical protein